MTVPSGVALAAALAAASLVGAAAAAPFGPGAPGAERAPGALVLGLSVGTGLDSVDHAPNVGGGRLAPPERRQRYADAALRAAWTPDPRLTLSGSFSRRRITFLRDAYEIDGWTADASIGLTPPGARADVDLELGASGNVDDSLDKNSWTRIDGAVLTDTRLTDARDLTLHANLTGALRTGARTRLRGLLGAGRVATRHAGVEGAGRDARGCAHRFAFADGGGRLEQVEPCGRVLSFSQDYADERAVDERFGLAPSRDLAWSALFWRVGGELEHRRGRLGLRLGGRYRRWLDSDLEAALRARDIGPVTVTRTAWAGASWALTPALRLDAAATWRTAPLLDEVPVLYNALSGDRYHTDALTFSLGLEYRLGR